MTARPAIFLDRDGTLVDDDKAVAASGTNDGLGLGLDHASPVPMMILAISEAG